MISFVTKKFKLSLKTSKAISHNTLKLVIAYLEAQVEYNQVKKLMNLSFETLEEYTEQVYSKNKSVYERLSQHFSYLMILKYFSDFNEFKNELAQSFIKKLTYPVILTLSIYGLLAFFLNKVFPMLFSLIESFQLDIASLLFVNKILWLLYIFLTVILVIVVILLILSFKRQNMKLGIIFCHKYPWFKLVKMVYTQMFAYMFLLMLRFGASTQQIIGIMRDSTLSYIVGWLAELTSYQLEDGKTFVNAIENNLLDEQFVSLVRLAFVDNKIIEYLETYLKLNNQRIEISLDTLSLRIKQVTYIFLALLMMLLYQVLLTPMQMMNNL